MIQKLRSPSIHFLCLGLTLGCAIFFLSGSVSSATVQSPNKLRLLVASTAAETGIIDFLVSGFREIHPEVEIITGKAGALEVLDQAREGLADVVITHHPKSEQLFLNEGYGISRTLIMYNEFAILGPRRDPLHLSREKSLDAVLRRLAQEQVPFLVPGLRSATSLALSELWSMVGLKPDWPGYELTGASSVYALKTADMLKSYSFTDIGTYLANRQALTGNIIPLFRDDIALRNYYSAVIISQKRIPHANQALAEVFVAYLTSEAAQIRLAHYGEERYGAQVYFPAAYLDEGLQARLARTELEKKTINLRWVIGLATGLLFLAMLLAVMFMQLRRAEKIRRISQERFRLAVEGTHDGIWDWDIESNCAFFSQRFKEIMGLPGTEGMHQDPSTIWARRMDVTSRERFLPLLQEYLASDSNTLFTAEYRLETNSEYPVWVVMRGQVLRNVAGQVVRMSGSITDITDAKRQEAELKQLQYRALHDSLTGLPNRAYLFDQLQQALVVAEQEKTSMALIAIDLDGFKKINDTLGHQAGDHVLQMTAQRLRQTLRASDMIARMGGDEFAVLLPASDEVSALGVVQKICTAFSTSLNLAGKHLDLGVSLGIALYPDHGTDITTLIACADMAMYAAKRSRSGYFVYHQT